MIQRMARGLPLCLSEHFEREVGVPSDDAIGLLLRRHGIQCPGRLPLVVVAARSEFPFHVAVMQHN